MNNYIETCTGKINYFGYCEKCGQKSESTSAYCYRTITIIPASSGTDTTPKPKEPVEELNLKVSPDAQRILDLMEETKQAFIAAMRIPKDMI